MIFSGCGKLVYAYPKYVLYHNSIVYHPLYIPATLSGPPCHYRYIYIYIYIYIYKNKAHASRMISKLASHSPVVTFVFAGDPPAAQMLALCAWGARGVKFRVKTGKLFSPHTTIPVPSAPIIPRPKSLVCCIFVIFFSTGAAGINRICRADRQMGR